jgi:hypothetical protein
MKRTDAGLRLPTVTKQELLDAIRDGVYDAVWQMIRNATDAPCADFFEMVKQGVTEGICSMDVSDAVKNGVMEGICVMDDLVVDAVKQGRKID